MHKNMSDSMYIKSLQFKAMWLQILLVKVTVLHCGTIGPLANHRIVTRCLVSLSMV